MTDSTQAIREVMATAMYDATGDIKDINKIVVNRGNLQALLDALDAAKKDAERYRYIKEKSPGDVDQQIDRAMETWNTDLHDAGNYAIESDKVKG
jgi:hypothetical protein